MIYRKCSHICSLCALGVSNVLFKTHLTCNAVNDVIGLAATTSDGVVIVTCNWTFNGSTCVQFNAINFVTHTHQKNFAPFSKTPVLLHFFYNRCSRVLMTLLKLQIS